MDSPLPFDAPGQEVLLIFRAGKMIFQGAQVQADTRKGLVRILRGDEGLIHFQWLDRTTDLVEDDQIVFPDEAVFEKVQQSSGRVYILKFKHDDRKYFFWMQEPRADGDDQLCNSVNLIMNCPPDDEEEELSPDSILQTDQISRDTYPGTSMEGSAAATVGGTQAVQLSDLQRILTNIGQTYGATELSHALMRDTGPSFSEILKPDIVLPLLENCHLEERLGPFLPEGRWTPGAIAELMQSPQFHQQLEAFTHVLRSGQIDLSQFGIDPSKCDFTVASFLEAIEDQVVEKQENAVVKADTKPANESGSAGGHNKKDNRDGMDETQ